MSTARTAADRPASVVLPATLRLGAVHLTVKDLDRSIEWYERALGLLVRRRNDGEAELGDGAETIIVLHADPQAGPPGRHAGLFHYALLYPQRAELARAALRLSDARAPVQGLSDHGTHEAIYLADAEGNGIELAADRPREQWPADAYAGGPAPLDFEDLVSTVDGDPPPAHVAEGLRVGHMHLQVGDIDDGLAFYRDVLGFELQANLGTAAFLSAGGYHHHIAFNVWKGRGIGPQPPHTVGLHHWTIRLPSGSDVAAVRTRSEAADASLENVDGGFRAYDPWRLAVDVAAA